MTHVGEGGPIEQSRARVLLRRAKLAVVIVSGVVATAVLLIVLAGTVPTLFGYNAFVLTGSSMVPAVPVGSIVVARPIAPESLQVGNVVTFRRPQQPAVSITHRIVVAIASGDGTRLFVTKGDANEHADVEPASFHAMVDRMEYAVPLAGYVVGFGRSRQGVALLLVLPALALVATEGFAWRRRRRESSGRRGLTASSPSNLSQAAPPPREPARLHGESHRPVASARAPAGAPDMPSFLRPPKRSAADGPRTL